MILKSFTFKTKDWQLKGLDNLALTNLLVGVNASGKTRTIRSLISVVSFLQSKPYLFQVSGFKTNLEFENEEEDFHKMIYSFEIENGNVKSESLKVDNSILIKRTVGKALLKGEPIDPPENKLITQIRRDRTQYPQIEKLMAWAEKVTFISFSVLNPFTHIMSNPFEINPESFSDMIDSFTAEEKKNFLKEVSALGYKVSDIDVISVAENKIVEIKESTVKTKIVELLLSNGMLRVLYIMAFLIKLRRESDKYGLLLIDDLGEGLDYQRATELGRKVFSTCEKYKVQLIASSNDGLIMDVVDLQKWQILRRVKSRIHTINYSKYPGLYEEFYCTGLSNFDFFSSDFIDRYLQSKK